MLLETLLVLALAAAGDEPQQPTMEQMRQRNPASGRCEELLTEEAIAGFNKLSEAYPRANPAQRSEAAKRLTSLLEAAAKKLPPSEFLFHVSFFPCAVPRGETNPAGGCPQPVTVLNTGLPDFAPATFVSDLRVKVGPKHFEVQTTEHLNSVGWTSELHCVAAVLQ